MTASMAYSRVMKGMLFSHLAGFTVKSDSCDSSSSNYAKIQALGNKTQVIL